MLTHTHTHTHTYTHTHNTVYIIIKSNYTIHTQVYCMVYAFAAMRARLCAHQSCFTHSSMCILHIICVHKIIHVSAHWCGYTHQHTYIYCNQQKLSQRKVLWLIGFCHNVGKYFKILLLTRTKTMFRVFIGMSLFLLWKCKFSEVCFAAWPSVLVLVSSALMAAQWNQGMWSFSKLMCNATSLSASLINFMPTS